MILYLTQNYQNRIFQHLHLSPRFHFCLLKLALRPEDRVIFIFWYKAEYVTILPRILQELNSVTEYNLNCLPGLRNRTSPTAPITHSVIHPLSFSTPLPLLTEVFCLFLSWDLRKCPYLYLEFSCLRHLP